MSPVHLSPEPDPTLRPVGYEPASRWVAQLFATVLVAAAGLKLWAVLKVLPAGPFSLAGNLILPAAELALAGWLIAGWTPRLARRVAIVVLSLFVIVTASKWAYGSDDCGCFGPVHVRPAQTLLLDASLLVAFVVVDLRRAGSAPWPMLGRNAVALGFVVLLAAAIYTASQVIPAAPVRTVYIDSKSVQGDVFPLLGLLNAGADATLARGLHHVILYRHDCDTCQQLVERYARTGQQSDRDGVEWIDTAGATPAKFAVRSALSLSPDVQVLSDRIPVEMVLMNGIVADVRDPNALDLGS